MEAFNVVNIENMVVVEGFLGMYGDNSSVDGLEQLIDMFLDLRLSNSEKKGFAVLSALKKNAQC